MKHALFFVLYTVLGYMLFTLTTNQNTSATSNQKASSLDTSHQSWAPSKKIMNGSFHDAPSYPELLSDIQKKGPLHKQLTKLAQHISVLNSEQIKKELTYLGDTITPLHTLLFERWAQLDPEAALQTIAKNNTYSRTPRLTEQVYKIWLNKDEQAAFAHFEKNKSDRQNPTINNTFAEYLLSHDAKKGLKWMKDNFTSTTWISYNNLVFNKLAESYSPEDIVQLSSTLDLPAHLKEKMFHQVAKYWGDKDWTKAEQWIQTLPEENRQNLRNSAFSAYIKTHPEKAIPLLSRSEFKDIPLYCYIESFARYSPEKARDWILSRPTPENLEGILHVLNPLSKKNPQMTIDIVDSLPNSDIKGKAISKLINDNANIPPEKKLEYYLAMNQKQQNLSHFQIFPLIKKWYKSNPEKVNQWIDNAPISAEKKARFHEEKESGFSFYSHEDF